MKILCIKGTTQYGVLNFFIDDIAEGFKMCGWDVTIMELVDSPEGKMTPIYSESFDYIFAFNGMLEPHRNVFQKNPDAVFISFFVDHPYYHALRVKNLRENDICIFIDRNHVRYAKEMYPHLKNVFFVPHGGNRAAIERKQYSDRTIQVSFFGSRKNYKEIEQKYWGSLSENLRVLASSVADRVIGTSGSTLEDAICQVLNELRVEYDNGLFMNLVTNLQFIDEYVRNLHRESVLAEIANAGIELHIFGNGWETCELGNVHNVNIHGSIEYDKVLEVMNDSKMVITNMPLFRDGSHERVFTTMLNGAVCVTEENRYLREEFTDEGELLFYKVENPDEMIMQMRKYLVNQEDAAAIADRGYAVACERHLWMNRAKEVIHIINDINW